MSNFFSGKYKKNIINLLSADYQAEKVLTSDKTKQIHKLVWKFLDFHVLIHVCHKASFSVM